MAKLRALKKSAFLFLFIFIILNCPKKVTVKTNKIEAIYLGSLTEDIKRPQPYLSGIKDLKGIKLGYINFENPFMHELFLRLGFYKILDDVPLDFLITNHPVYDHKFLSIPINLGYGFKNLEGIRFAIFSKDVDTLGISGEIKLATVRERSDVLWILDKNSFSLPPSKIDFIIKNRILQDTLIRNINLKIDTVLFNKLQQFNQLLAKTFQTRISLNNSPLSDFIFQKIKEKKNINVMLFPVNLIKDNSPRDSITISEFMDLVKCDTRFKVQELTKSEINRLLKEKIYVVLGDINKKNTVLIPDNDGEFLFDLIFY
jgi:hypothetical protein|uniref:Uncharacterized protein n=1 Tax=candidate division WOR-3 bacterium TaxID=2052148 RepID=A0A7C4TBX1_UNCW3